MTARTLKLCLAPLLLLTFACNRNPETVKKNYIERGNEYFKNGKYKEASIMYRSALKKDLKYGEAYYRLGLSELRLGRPGDALRNLRRAYELQPDNVDAAKNLAELYLLAYISDPRRPKEFETALRDIQEAMAKKDPNSFLALKIRGYLALASRNIPEALKAFEAAHKVQPFSPDIITPLIESLAVQNRGEEAEKLAFQMIEKDKSHAASYDWLFLRFYSTNRRDEAEKIYVKKVENNPKQSQFIMQLAGFYLMTQRKPEMEKTLNRILSNKNDFPLGYAQVGDFYLRVRDVDTAEKYFKEGLKNETKSEQKAMYQKYIARTYLARNRKAEALEIVTQILKDNPKDNDAVAMRASLWLQEGGKEKVQAAINELSSVIQRNPENFVLRQQMGEAYMAKGDIDQARVQFTEAIKYRPDYSPARVAIAKLHLAKNEWTKAMQAADDILRYDPNNVVAHMVKTSSRMGMGDFPTARQELSAVLQANPTLPDALYQMGILNYQEKKFKEAEEAFLKLEKTAPNDPRGLVGRVETYAGTQRFDEAIHLLEEDLKKNPDRSFYRLALANVAVRAQKFDMAEANYKKLLEKSPKNFDVQIRLAETYRLKGNMPMAISEFQKARELNPSDPTAYVRLALLYETAGRRNDARPLYEQILKLDPDNAIALNNYAFALAETGGDLDQALTLAQRAKAKFPQDLNVADTLGWVLIKKNLSDQALKIFKEVVDKDAKNAIYRYHYALALAQKGDKVSAKRECETALKSNPSKEDEAKIKELMSRI